MLPRKRDICPFPAPIFALQPLPALPPPASRRPASLFVPVLCRPAAVSRTARRRRAAASAQALDDAAALPAPALHRPARGLLGHQPRDALLLGERPLRLRIHRHA